MNFSTLSYDVANRIARVTFNRPEVHNAFNAALISEMRQVLAEIDKDDSIRLVILTGAGKSFSAGADLNWMRSMVGKSYEENLDDSMELAE